MLRELASGVWVAERPLRFLGLAIETRMTVVQLADGGLFVHSPVALDPETRRSLDALGPVRCVVAPNRFHHLFVGDYPAAYPQAEVYAAPGLARKRRDIPFNGTLGDEPAAVWAGQIDQLVFRALPLFNEVVFFHRGSRTLLLTDLATNIRHARSFTSRLAFSLDGAYGTFGLSRLARLLVRDRAAGRASIDRILAWDFDRIVVAHGDVVGAKGRAALRASFAWLS